MNDFYDQIDLYLNGALEGPEAEAFENALQQDAQLQAAVERQRQIIAELDGMRLRQKIKQAAVKPAPGNKPWFLLSGVLVLILAAAYWFLKPEAPENPPAIETPQNSVTPPAQQPMAVDPGTPGTPDNQPQPQIPKQQPSVDPAIQEVYASAVQDLEDIDMAVMGGAQKDAALEQKLNQAIKFLKTNRANSAVPLLESVLDANNDLYRDDAEWLLALAWLPRDVKTAKNRLNAIAQNADHSHRIDALRLIKRLE